MRLRVAGLIVPLAAVGVSACGGSARLSRTQYEAKLSSTMTRMDDRINAAFRPLIPKLKSNDVVAPTTCSHLSGRPVCTPGGSLIPRSVRNRVSAQIRSEVEKAASTLAGLKPPTDVAADNMRLVEGIRDLLEPTYAGLSIIGAGPLPRANPHAMRRFIAASKDLERKGYKLQATSLAVRFALPTKRGKVPAPKDVKPRPFALLSTAGRQPAAHLQAATEVCQSSASGGGCTAEGFGTGLPELPAGLSVVRPGERIHFALPSGGSTLLPQGPVGSLDVNDLCRSDLAPSVTMAFLDQPGWTVRLKPGAYYLWFSFSWTKGGDQVEESGILGLLVSRTARETVLPGPRCA